MPVRPHRQYEEFFRILRDASGLLRERRGVAYRATSPPYASNRRMLSGVGAFRNGGRWGPPGLARTLYLSLDPSTAMAECLAHYRYYGWPVEDAMPRVFKAVEFRVQAVLDLTSPAVRRAVGVSWRMLVHDDWRAIQRSGGESLTQALGRAALRAGAEGLLAPSAPHRGGRNLVLFLEKLREGSVLRVRRAPRR